MIDKKVQDKTLLEWRLIYHAPDCEQTKQDKMLAWLIIDNWDKLATEIAIYTAYDLQSFGNSELIELILKLQDER